MLIFICKNLYMRSLIKKILREYVINEVSDRVHSLDRYSDRVTNTKTSNLLEKLGSKKEIDYKLDVLRKINFPKDVSFYVLLSYSPERDKIKPSGFDTAKGFYYYDPKKGSKGGPDWGHKILAIVENNEFVTILYTPGVPYKNKYSYERLREVKFDVLLDNLKKYKNITFPKEIEKVKSMKQVNLTNVKDYYNMTSPSYKKEPILKKSEDEIMIDDKSYIIDRDDMVFYLKNNPKDKKNIRDYVNDVISNAESLSPETAKLISKFIELQLV
jgi:hypothetical protein